MTFLLTSGIEHVVSYFNTDTIVITVVIGFGLILILALIVCYIIGLKKEEKEKCEKKS